MEQSDSFGKKNYPRTGMTRGFIGTRIIAPMESIWVMRATLFIDKGIQDPIRRAPSSAL